MMLSTLAQSRENVELSTGRYDSTPTVMQQSALKEQIGVRREVNGERLIVTFWGKLLGRRRKREHGIVQLNQIGLCFTATGDVDALY